MAMKLLQKTIVEAVTAETPRVRGLVLRHALRPRLQPFEAGAHVTLALPGGFNRQYSLCGDPGDDTRYRLGVLLDDNSRGGSRAVHDLRPGDSLFVSYPANSFPIAPDAGRHVLVAGGIGITPMLAMAQSLSAAGQPFEVHYGGRSLDEMAFVGKLRQVCPADDLHLYPESGPGATGMLDLAALFGGVADDAHVYCCGPTGMIDAFLAAAEAEGLPSDRVHVEKFSALGGGGEILGDPFEIEIVGPGKVVPVRANQTALQALREAGVNVPSSCEGGICGDCRLVLAGGQVLHRDAVLKPEERAQAFIACVSRGEGRIALDIPNGMLGSDLLAG